MVTLTHKCGIVYHICGTHKILIFGFRQLFLCPKFRNHSNNKNPKEFFWNFHWKFFSKNLPYFITDFYHNCSIVYHKCWIVCSLCIPQLWYSTPQMWDIIPVLQRSFKDLRSFEDFCPKIHLRLHLRFIFRCRRIFEASKILGRRLRRFFGKI